MRPRRAAIAQPTPSATIIPAQIENPSRTGATRAASTANAIPIATDATAAASTQARGEPTGEGRYTVQRSGL